MSESREAGAAAATDETGEARALVARLHETFERIRKEVGAIIVGQHEALEHLLLSVLIGGHCLITGMPGTAKTLLVRTLAAALGLTFRRIQFTPDLMPSDVTGTDVIEEDTATGHRRWSFVPGPLFTHVLLADEINRTPPKTQSALLEAMQELSVTVRGRTHRIEPPFLVLATQNPIELEGTYPLPEAQLDRFLFSVVLDYLSAEQEVEVLDRSHTLLSDPQIQACTSAGELMRFRELVKNVPVAASVQRYAVDLVRATRPADPSAPPIVREYLSYGASVRSTQMLAFAAKARALLAGRYHVQPEDVRALAHPVLRHRVFRNYHAEAAGVEVDTVVRAVAETVPEPRV
jgi:MoxR-like ATPase